MRLIKKVDAFISKTIETVITALLILILCMVFIQTCLRYFFSSSIYGVDELITIFFIYASTLGAALALRRREHISIKNIFEKMPTSASKILLKFHYIIIALFNIIIMYFSVLWLKKTMFVISQVTKLPFWVKGIALPISCLIVVFYCIYIIILINVNSSKLHEEIGDSFELKESLDSIRKNTDGEVGKA